MSEAEDRRPEINVEHRYERFFSGPIPPASEFEYYAFCLANTWHG